MRNLLIFLFSFVILNVSEANMEKQIYRIEIGDRKFWIGLGCQLMTHIDLAIPVTHQEHMMIMDKINVEATAYNDTLAWYKCQASDTLPADHSKIAPTLRFNFHSDSGHGWLAVKLDLIRELGLASQISVYSYMKGKTAYLEEDSDATKFVNAFKAKFGIEPKIRDLVPQDRSPIRSMKRFEMGF
jgi:hypothetical protein